MAQRTAERCINPSEERFLGSQQRHKRESSKGYEPENLSRTKKKWMPESGSIRSICAVILCAYFHSVPFERLQEIGIFPVRATAFTLLRSDSALASLAGFRNPVTGQSTIAR